MRYMVIVEHSDHLADYEAGKLPPNAKELFAAMGKFNEELVEAGIMLAGEGLRNTSKGVRIHFPGNGKPQTVTHGPFKDTANLVCGFWIWNVKSEEEALVWAKRAPMEDGATLELRQIAESSDFGEEIEAQENKLRERIAQRKAG